ncbi:rhodanese-like domain-containing protein [Salibacter halophilus]|uniref:Rhodanese-like domain-containing protein n=1 Tax=Salibacter halophilus TaxID=1803916 RepID=A0A6N6M6B2_9FLAO|nr:rhodanese-like domain-containing protein [Salibacter halophilus]KAB1063792.1 rhodanese-like domain-containing protein [Salibacter halophilus]
MLGFLKKLLGGNIMFENINAHAFEKEIQNNPDAVLIDVRTPGEFESGHIPNAVNLNLQDPAFQSELQKLDKSKKYLVYCRSGARSFNACNIMTNSGFDDVTNLQGGIVSWRGEVAVQ